MHTSSMAEATGQAEAASGLTNNTAGRKRSLSLSSEAASNKIMKIGLSPVPAARIINVHDGTTRSNNSNSRKPTFNIQVLAATVLYAAFEHLDHWPVPLVSAYADDCFGPRLWVDHKLCALLVANLALAHDCFALGEGERDNDTMLMADAASVAVTYRTLGSSARVGSNAPPRTRLQRESSADSFGSTPAPTASSRRAFRSQASSISAGSQDSSNETGTIEQNSQRGNDRKQFLDSESSFDGKNPSARNMPTPMDADRISLPEAEEGDDDHTTRTNRGGEYRSPTSTSEIVTSQDETRSVAERGIQSAPPEAFLSETAARCESNGHKPLGGHDILYPIIQKGVLLRRVRLRFFGENLKLAHEAITSSFADRLDVKSKQNSSLIQCLPSFTSIPGVRSLVAANLEKWLQSPALAGLARTLFSCTVKHLQNVDPPLSEDLQAIDYIIGMRLKANQVRTLGSAASNPRRV